MGTTEPKVTKSGEIRRLASGGMARAEIARTLGVRYQFVRNVLCHDKERALAKMTQLTLDL